jgi:hypothetical protein
MLALNFLDSIALFFCIPSVLFCFSPDVLRVQALLDFDRLVAENYFVSYQTGFSYDSLVYTLRGLYWVLESTDLLLLAVELVSAVLLFAAVATFKGRLQKQLAGYDDFVTFCQLRGVSVAELFGLITFALGFIFFDMFVSLAEDDSLESLSYIFASVIFCAVFLLFLATDVQFYFLVSSISGGELTLRTIYTDIVNNGLCLLRVFFC